MLEDEAAKCLHEKMRDLLAGYRVTQMLVVAATFGVADALAEGPRSVDELAAAAGAHAPSLYRVLRTLASMGIFRETEARWFELTPLAQSLRSDVPGSIYYAAMTYSEAWWWDAWGNMAEGVRTGETAFEHLHGMGMFEFMDKHPDAAARFNAHMVMMTDTEARTLVAAYDFSSCRRIVDVGGGHGALIHAILRAHPQATGVLYDQPATVVGAQRRFEQAGYSDRCEFVGGNFFESVPGGADTYVMKNIIHDWNDESARRILHNCRRAMTDGAKLILIEHIIPEGNEPSIGKIWDMTMLVIVGGAERTEREYRELLHSCGFSTTSVVRTSSGTGIIEAVLV